MRCYRLFVHAFPRAWRHRYGDELLRVLETDDRARPAIWSCLDLLRSGVAERLHALRRLGNRRTTSTSIVAFKTAAARAAEARRRRAGRWAAVALPLLVVAAGAPFALHVEDGLSPSRAALPTAGARPIVAYTVVGGKRVDVSFPSRPGDDTPVAGELRTGIADETPAYVPGRGFRLGVAAPAASGTSVLPLDLVRVRAARALTILRVRALATQAATQAAKAAAKSATKDGDSPASSLVQGVAAVKIAAIST